MWARSPEVTIDALRRVGDPTKNKSLVKGEEYDSNMVATSVAAKSQGEILASPAAADGAGPILEGAPRDCSKGPWLWMVHWRAG